MWGQALHGLSCLRNSSFSRATFPAPLVQPAVGEGRQPPPLAPSLLLGSVYLPLLPRKPPSPRGDVSTLATGAAQPGGPRRVRGGRQPLSPSMEPGRTEVQRQPGLVVSQIRNGILASYCLLRTVHLGTICHLRPLLHLSIHIHTHIQPLTKRLSNHNLLWQPAGINAIKRVFNGLIDWSRYHVLTPVSEKRFSQNLSPP